MSEERQPENETAAEKNSGNVLVSIFGLIVILLAVIYLLPMVNEYLQNRSQTEQKESNTEVLEGDDSKADIPESLKAWYPLVMDALGKSESRYEIKHMRLNKDGTKLLLDLRAIEPPRDPLEVIMTRDEFGRYSCDHSQLKFKFYPPAEEGEKGE